MTAAAVASCPCIPDEVLFYVFDRDAEINWTVEEVQRTRAR